MYGCKEIIKIKKDHYCKDMIINQLKKIYFFKDFQLKDLLKVIEFLNLLLHYNKKLITFLYYKFNKIINIYQLIMENCILIS